MTDQSKITEVGQDVLGELRKQDPARAEKAKHLFTLILSREATGLVLSLALEAKLRKLPAYAQDEFDDEVASLGLGVLDAVLTHHEKRSPPPPEPMVSPKQVFDHLVKVNTYFQ